mmetsp:Transcript_62138/g.128824  ORF Transcript_62138/g.128824 Transcript_62138/m.128824 type:complete len:200 (-) Transcript_62138:1157-1756(-)
MSSMSSPFPSDIICLMMSVRRTNGKACKDVVPSRLLQSRSLSPVLTFSSVIQSLCCCRATASRLGPIPPSIVVATPSLHRWPLTRIVEGYHRSCERGRRPQRSRWPARFPRKRAISFAPGRVSRARHVALKASICSRFIRSMTLVCSRRMRWRVSITTSLVRVRSSRAHVAVPPHSSTMPNALCRSPVFCTGLSPPCIH